MKKVLVSAILLAFAHNAFASKARVNSLQGANHIIDTQTVFTVPSHILLLNPYLTFEGGTAGTDAEGGIMRNTGGGKMLVYLGHQNTTAVDGLADVRTGNGYIEQNNPLEVIYGTGKMGFGVSASHVENKKTGNGETTLVGKWGMNTAGDGWLYAHVHAFSRAYATNAGVQDKMVVMPFLKAGGAMNSGNLHFFGEVNYGMATEEPGAAAAQDEDIKDLDVMVGVEDRSLKTQAADIYYGIKATYASRDFDGDNITAYKLPGFVGIELPVVTWATFRASVQQNILIGQTKDETATNTDEDGIPSDTTVAAGLGLNYKGLTVDGSLTAAGNGNLNGSTFLSQVSATYSF